MFSIHTRYAMQASTQFTYTEHHAWTFLNSSAASKECDNENNAADDHHYYWCRIVSISDEIFIMGKRILSEGSIDQYCQSSQLEEEFNINNAMTNNAPNVLVCNQKSSEKISV